MLPTTMLQMPNAKCAFSTVRPNRYATIRRTIQCTAEPAEVSVSERATPAQADNKNKAYVGKGRYVSPDDVPKEFPVIAKTGRDSELTGGFAGGEVGLKSFVAANPGAKPAKKEAAPAKATYATKGSKAVYVGKGRYLADGADPKIVKRTGRDNSLTGGFAGGELGLQSYVKTGDVVFSEGQGRRQQSPLIIAGIMSAAAVTGGVLLTDVSDFGERALTGTAGVSPAALSSLDENTKLLLEVAVLLVGVVGTVVGGQALVSSFTNNLKEGVSRLATLAAFWLAVFVAARFILDSP